MLVIWAPDLSESTQYTFTHIIQGSSISIGRIVSACEVICKNVRKYTGALSQQGIAKHEPYIRQGSFADGRQWSSLPGYEWNRPFTKPQQKQLSANRAYISSNTLRA